VHKSTYRHRRKAAGKARGGVKVSGKQIGPYATDALDGCCAYMRRKKGSAERGTTRCDKPASWNSTLRVCLCKEHKPERCEYKKKWQKGTLGPTLAQQVADLTAELAATCNTINALSSKVTEDSLKMDMMARTIDEQKTQLDELASIIKQADSLKAVEPRDENPSSELFDEASLAPSTLDGLKKMFRSSGYNSRPVSYECIDEPT